MSHTVAVRSEVRMQTYMNRRRQKRRRHDNSTTDCTATRQFHDKLFLSWVWSGLAARSLAL